MSVFTRKSLGSRKLLEKILENSTICILSIVPNDEEGNAVILQSCQVNIILECWHHPSIHGLMPSFTSLGLFMLFTFTQNLCWTPFFSFSKYFCTWMETNWNLEQETVGFLHEPGLVRFSHAVPWQHALPLQPEGDSHAALHCCGGLAC